MRVAHITVAVRLKPRMTILLKRKRAARSGVRASWRNRLRDRVVCSSQFHRGRPSLDTTRLNDACLCGISQLNYELRWRCGAAASAPNLLLILTEARRVN
jgi:hypothetical protein